MKFPNKDFLNKCDQTRIWSQLLKKSLMENFIFCVVIGQCKFLVDHFEFFLTKLLSYFERMLTF